MSFYFVHSISNKPKQCILIIFFSLCYNYTTFAHCRRFFDFVVRFVGSFLDTEKLQKGGAGAGDNHTHNVNPRENAIQVAGMLPLLVKEMEGKRLNTTTTATENSEIIGGGGKFSQHDNGTSTYKSERCSAKCSL